MNFWDFFRKKDKEKESATDSSTGFVPMTAVSDPDSSNTDVVSHEGNDAGSATSTDSGAGSFGGDGGGAGGGDGGGA